LKKQAPAINIVTENSASIIKDLPFDILIIDTPPTFAGLEEILQICDFVLVPTGGNLFDAMAIEHIAEFIRLVQTRFTTKAGVVMNRIRTLSGDAAEVHKYIKGLPIRLLDTIVHDRVAFAKSPIVYGVSATGDLKAINEIELLVEEIMGIIDL
jgi:chromosome partitioning protein